MAKRAKKATFASVMAKQQDAWDRARKVKDTGGIPDNDEIAESLKLEDGDSVNFPARVNSCKLGVDRNSNPYANLSFVGIGGAGKGVTVPKGYFFSDTVIKSGDRKGDIITSEDKQERFFIDLKRIGCETDGDSFSVQDLEKIAEDITKTKPGVKIRVSYRSGYINLFINKKLAEYEISEYENNGAVYEEEESDTAPTTLKVAEEEVEEEVEEEEEEEEDVDPEAGMFCAWKSNRMKEPADFEIMEVDAKKKTATLRRDSDDKTFEDVAWDAIIELYDE